MLCILLLGFVWGPALAQQAVEDAATASGSQSGPPFWKVSNGGNELWILPLINAVPSSFVWDDDRLAGVIADASEFIGAPDVSVGVSEAILLNPLNAIRAFSLYRRLTQLPGGATLVDLLPEPLYQRFAAVKAEYVPDDAVVDRLRPAFAAELIDREVRERLELASAEVITDRVKDVIERNSNIRQTDVKVEWELEGSLDELVDRLEVLAEQVPPQDEIDCFESQLSRWESGFSDVMVTANAWSSGDFDGLVQSVADDGSCFGLLGTSPEGELMEKVLAASQQRWLDAAISALERNRLTFSMLPMIYVTGSSSLLRAFDERGYTVQGPG